MANNRSEQTDDQRLFKSAKTLEPADSFTIAAILGRDLPRNPGRQSPNSSTSSFEYFREDGTMPLPLRASNRMFDPVYQEVASVCQIRYRQGGCEVCFTTPPRRNGRDERTMRVCGLCASAICFPCFSAWLEVRIQAGQVRGLRCLNCIEPISNAEILLHCGEHLYRKHLYFLSKYAQGGNPHATWCPKDGCWRLLYAEQRALPRSVKFLTCPDCSTQVCANCELVAHSDAPCPTPNLEVGKRVRANLWRRLHTKKCPECSAHIQRSGGCSQMRCTSCETKWCWRCRGVFLEVSTGTRRRACICPQVHTALTWVTLTGGIIISVPILLVSSVFVLPPATIYYVAASPERRGSIRDYIFELGNRL